MKAKHFTLRFPEYSERNVLSSVLRVTFHIALAAAVASASPAQTTEDAGFLSDPEILQLGFTKTS